LSLKITFRVRFLRDSGRDYQGGVTGGGWDSGPGKVPRQPSPGGSRFNNVDRS